MLTQREKNKIVWKVINGELNIHELRLLSPEDLAEIVLLLAEKFQALQSSSDRAGVRLW